MKRIVIICSLTILNFWNSQAQGLINRYMFGYTGLTRGNMNLYSGFPLINADSITTYNLSYTHANISDSTGNLLFYTNGVVVMDGNHDTMPNGRGLNPCAYTTQFKYDGLSLPQGDLILPDPGNNNQYYLIHQSVSEYPNDFSNTELFYSKVNLNLNNGHGDVTLKNILFYQDSFWGGGASACKHANGRDWWLVIPRAKSPDYLLFLLSPIGINYYSTQNVGTRWDLGQVAFSNDGNHYGYYDWRDGMEIFDFDRCSGVFSNPRYVNVNDSSWGLGFCFSPDSKLAYAANAIYLYQLNLDSANLTTGMQVVVSWDSTYDPWPPVATTFEFMQIGPDGKIYMTTVWGTQRMQYINYPDSIGIVCDMKQHSLILPTYNHCTMPNFINYFLGPVVGSICDSLGLGVPEYALHDFKFLIQPNPLKDNILHCKYQLPQNKSGVMEITEITGSIILKEPLPQWSTEQHIKLTVSPGIYLVKLTSSHQQVVKKIIVP